MSAGLLKETEDRDSFRQACKAYVRRFGTLKSYSRYQAPSEIFWDDLKYQGEAYPAFGWAIYVAEVTVDTTTYAVTVDDFVALQEVGRVLHPVLAAGQIEGGVAQGIGFALYEKISWDHGRMMNGQMTNYIIPTSQDISPIRVYFEEIPSVHGPYGAKGIGELPMDGPAPAIINAINNAMNTKFNSIPLFPEDIFLTLSNSAEKAMEVGA
jgi:CO/xanthine dehydrogenase Mo-binding subunit